MKRSVLLLVCVLCLPAASSVYAQQTAPKTVSGIEVVGALTVGERQVLAWSGFETGKTFTRDMVAAGIRRLFATKKFSDIFVYQQPTAEGVKLIVNLHEFPRVRSIVFRGNKKIKEGDLRDAFPVSVGQFANPAAINRDLETIRELYYEKGYYNVGAHTDSTVVDVNNLEDLVVTIAEGKKVKVKTISFTGNEVMTADDLRDAMEQGTTGFLRSGTFKKQQFEDDRERIAVRCRDSGFLDAEVTEVEMNFRPGREELDLVIHLAEGPQYYVGDINWEGNTVFDDVRIADYILLQRDAVFAEKEYHETLVGLHQLYANQGYIYITVEPIRDIQDQHGDINFQFIEGQPATIRDIQISGNVKTYDNVILREMRIYPGDKFSQVQIERSGRDLMALGFFEDIRPDYRPIDDGGEIDLIMKVQERQTGQFMFGMAYSAQTRATGFIQVAETNFRGKGQNIGVTWQFGTRRRYVDLSFTEPWFLGTPTLMGADLFDRYMYNYDDFYESRVRGFSVRLGRRIPGTRLSNVGLRYELSETRLSNFSGAYVKYLDELEQSIGVGSVPFERLDEIDWPRSKSALRLSVSRNSTDNPFFPTAGSKNSYYFELAGGPLGGEIEFAEHQLKTSYFTKMPGGFALNLRAFMGLIGGIGGKSVPDYEKYRLGGNRLYPLRGYSELEVVPRGNPGFIGGRFFTILNAELLYPLTNAVQLLTFLDQGDVWNYFGEADFANMRKGAGFGIRVEVPMMGMIGFDWGYGFDRAGGGGWEPHFNIGQFF